MLELCSDSILTFIFKDNNRSFLNGYWIAKKINTMKEGGGGVNKSRG